MAGDQKGAVQGLQLTVFLGVVLTLLQALEYNEAPLTIADRVYGSVLFIATGFHGFHVIVGSIFLAVCLFRIYYFHFSPRHHVGLESAIWY